MSNSEKHSGAREQGANYSI